MSQSNWEADKMLDVYIYDYLVKKKLHNTAKSFMNEGKVSPDPVAIDAPGGFLFEWWSVFWDIFIARTNEKHSEAAAAYIETQQIKAKEQQMQMQQLQLMRQAQLQRGGPNAQTLGGPVNAISSEGMLGQSNTAKMYDERMKHSNQMDSETSQPLLDPRMALLKSATNHPGQLVHGNSGNASAALQQMQARTQQGNDIKGEVNVGAGQRSLSMDPSSIYGQGIMQSKSGLGNAGLNPAASGLPLKGWPLTVSMQQSSSQQQDPLQPQQTQQVGSLNISNRKRKGASSSGPANSTGTGNTVGPNSQPSTPSTHTPGDGVAAAANMQNVSSMSKGIMMYGADGAGALASSTNQLEDIEHFGDVGDVESFLSHDEGDGRDLFGTLKREPSEHAEASKAGFSFREVGSIRKSSSKVVCCHFSTDGKWLASAGHDKKVVLWNMETLHTESTPEDHAHIITDVRFRPNSTQLATSSFDTTVRLWDAAEPRYALQSYTGHTSHVLSLDFHPKKNDLFCSCDGNNEIRFWNMSQQYSCVRISKGGTAQVRFQPRTGQLLAAAAENIVSVFDVETDRLTHSLKGHAAEVHSVCWDINGDLLATASQESVRVWSLASGECIHELSSSGNKFHSCVFHPTFSTLLVIGGYQSLELWNMAENKCMTIPAHDCVISALVQSPVTGMVASASHDKCVKIWK
ncbi:Transcriptional corepressor LEUNIG_HOMOLOG [Linum perenne]